MSSLSSTSTNAEVEAAYDDNASYAEDVSLAKCRAFITAVRILIRRLPLSSAKAGTSQTYSIESLTKELDEAREWLLDHTEDDGDRPGPNVTRADFRNSRS